MKFETYMDLTRFRSAQILIALIGFLYIIFIILESPFIFMVVSRDIPSVLILNDTVLIPQNSNNQELLSVSSVPYGLIFNWKPLINSNKEESFLGLNKSAISAFQKGEKFWEDLISGRMKQDVEKEKEKQKCRNSITMSRLEFIEKGNIMVLPCGLTVGSNITVVGKPKKGVKNGDVMKLGFMLELIGEKNGEGEELSKILHYNPRLKGDWSGKAVIEENSYRQEWGISVRCEGWKSESDEETVDGLIKCEKWFRDDESWVTWWLNRLLRWRQKVTRDPPFPFSEEKVFVMTLRAGFEGYHVYVDERHVTSFLYRTGFSIEDATELRINGDIDVYSISSTSLPSSRLTYTPLRHLNMSSKWQAPKLPNEPVELFIGIISAGNHFAERMCIRKSWLRHELIKSSKVVTRFFVALHARKEVNVELKKEAEFFGDIVIVPYMDDYDLIVLKTIAIFEYGVRIIDAEHIMKCDDDTFVRVDAVLEEVNKIPKGKSFYVGSIVYNTPPLRTGKWAVKYEEWAEEYYPNYAVGPGYILSSDVAHFIVSEFEKHKLRLFKMEDVSVGMWVQLYNNSKPVEYVHNSKFYKYGCINDYYTAHYQSPEHMICLWNKLQQLGRPLCCEEKSTKEGFKL